MTGMKEVYRLNEGQQFLQCRHRALMIAIWHDEMSRAIDNML